LLDVSLEPTPARPDGPGPVDLPLFAAMIHHCNYPPFGVLLPAHPTMKAVVVNQDKSVSFQEKPDPKVGPKDVVRSGERGTRRLISHSS
jgi:hypothetical protein